MKRYQKIIIYFLSLLFIFLIFPSISKAFCEEATGTFSSMSVYQREGLIYVEAYAEGGNTQCACPADSKRVWDWTSYEATFEYQVKDEKGKTIIGWTGLVKWKDYSERPGNSLTCNDTGEGKSYSYDILFSIPNSDKWSDGTYTITLRGNSNGTFTKSSDITICTDECSPEGSKERRCSGGWVQERTCGDYDSDPCLEWSGWENVRNCNEDDGCVGTSYYDWSCIYGGCISEEYPNDPRCSPQKPYVPELVAPPDDSWINQNPTLTVRVSDPNNKQVRAEFELYADFNGNRKVDEGEYFYYLSGFYPSGSNISWSLSLPDFTPYTWRARARNEDGYWSDWSQFWTFHKDTIPPQAQISYNLECATSSNFPVYLEESDNLAGIKQGLVQISIEGGDWQDYKQTTEDFTYSGKEGTTYQFRYRVQDKAGNLSDWATGPSQTLSINHPPTATNLRVQLTDPCDKILGALLRWDFSDPDGDSQYARHIQIDDDSDFSSPIIDIYDEQFGSTTAYAFQEKIECDKTYYWRVKVWDSPCQSSSSWIEGPSFSTQGLCYYPIIDFSWRPQRISFSQPIQFIDQSTCYDESSLGFDCSSEDPFIDSFNWHFLLTKEDEWGETQTIFETSTTTENPVITLPYMGDLEITLIVTDSQGRSCPKTVNTSSRFPVWVWKTWREINPACFWLRKFPCD